MVNVIETGVNIGWRNHQALLKNGLTVAEKLKAAGHGHLAQAYKEALNEADTLFQAAHILNRR